MMTTLSVTSCSNLMTTDSETQPIVPTGIVFIDPNIDDYEMLRAGVQPGLEAVLLDGSRDGIVQITEALDGHRNLSSLHIVSHGEAGSLWLGSGVVNNSTLNQYSDKVQSWAVIGI